MNELTIEFRFATCVTDASGKDNVGSGPPVVFTVVGSIIR